jgi:hypothetical protein
MTVIIEGTEHVTAADAAVQLNTTQLRILMLVKEQALVGKLLDGTWYISRPSLACAEVHGTDRKESTGCRSYCSSSGCGCR